MVTRMSLLVSVPARMRLEHDALYTVVRRFGFAGPSERHDVRGSSTSSAGGTGGAKTRTDFGRIRTTITTTDRAEVVTGRRQRHGATRCRTLWLRSCRHGATR